MLLLHLNLKADPTICTSIFLFNKGKVLYGRRHYNKRTLLENIVWTTPGGRCDKDETIEDNLRRETKEETGITSFTIRKFLGIVPGAKKGDTLYVYQGVTAEEPVLAEPKKFSEWRWFNPLEKLPDFINPAAHKLLLQNFDG